MRWVAGMLAALLLGISAPPGARAQAEATQQPERVELAYRYAPGQKLSWTITGSGKLYVSGLPAREGAPSAFPVEMQWLAVSNQAVTRVTRERRAQLAVNLERLALELTVMDHRAEVEISRERVSARADGKPLSLNREPRLRAAQKVISQPAQVEVTPRGEITRFASPVARALASAPGSEYARFASVGWGGGSLFLELPGRPVEVGEVWFSRRIMGLGDASPGADTQFVVSSTHQLEKVETRHGRRVAIIRSTVDVQPVSNQSSSLNVSFFRFTGRSAFDLGLRQLTSGNFRLQLNVGMELPLPPAAGSGTARAALHGELMVNYRARVAGPLESAVVSISEKAK